MTHRVKPDVIIGSESWLKLNHLNSNFFLYEFDVHLKERIGKTGGGVFVAIHSTFSSTVDIELDTVLIVSYCGPRWKWEVTRICAYRHLLPKQQRHGGPTTECTGCQVVFAGGGPQLVHQWPSVSHFTLWLPPACHWWFTTREAGKLLTILDGFSLHQSN